MITILLFAAVGFLAHAVRKYDSYRLRAYPPSLYEYLRVNGLNIIVSALLSFSLVMGGILDNAINWETAIAVGYAGDNFFRYLLDRKKRT